MLERTTIVAIEFNLREFGHPLSILRLRRFFEKSQWLPVDDLLLCQEQLLRRTVAHAYEQVPYYQGLFRQIRLRPADVRTLADLQKIPRLPKAILRAEFVRLQARDKDRHSPRWYQTSGTSGEPVRFLLDKPANILEFVHYWRHWSWAGYRLGDRFAELTSQHFLGDEKLARQRWCYQWKFGRLLLNSLFFSVDNVAGYAGILRKYRPRFLKGTASALYFLALFFKQTGIADIAFEGTFATGEQLLPSQRRLIEEVFHGKVYDSYGHMERTVAISECPQGGFHINPEYGVLELVEKTPVSSATTEPGARRFTAKVVGTSLHNRSMPLLRYEVNDVVEVEEPATACACGRAMPRIVRVNGRHEDVITTPDGRVIPTLFVVFDTVPGVRLGQVVQEEPARLVIRIVPSEEYTRRSETALVTHVRRFVGFAMRVEVEYLSAAALRATTAGKFRTVISRVPSHGITTARPTEPANAFPGVM